MRKRLTGRKAATLAGAAVAFSVLTMTSGRAFAQLHASDIALKLEQGQLVTGGIDGGVATFPQQVFSSVLGAYGIPGASFDPGFDSETGALPASTAVGVTMRRALRKWNGADFDTVPPERIEIIRNETIITPELDPPFCAGGPSLQIGLTTSTGRLHQHPAYRLAGPGGTEPGAGVYLLELSAWVLAPGEAGSEPFFILFSHNESQLVLEAAAEWADLHLARPCYANCDRSTTQPVLNVDDFTCFINKFAQGACYANCDGSTTTPVLNVDDFTCFINQYAQGCP